MEVLLMLGVVAAAAVITAVSSATPERQAAATTTPAAGNAPVVSAEQRTEPDGRRVYLRDCAWCHGTEGEGSYAAPSLDKSGEMGAHFQLTTGRMPLASLDDEPEPGPPAYSPETIAAIVDYVGIISTGPDVPEAGVGNMKRGRTLFLHNCAPCHSSAGTGMILPDGSFASELLDSSRTQVVEAMRLGPGQMPPFPETQLDRRQAEAIATYVRQLGDEQQIGGRPLDWIGPIYEGAVAWLIGIPVLVIVIRLLGKRAK